ncbi:hypothetical protein [Hyphomonas sp.]|uniref:hypothetical protein n=1 Tax=Hyphomonas sp. TaxID=87 RepID=UPI000C932225|nr:hypothetical protein [Hyphomonas sp.]MAL47085.1 hypothetical protein [Hyphomonas sp.]
MAKLTKEQIALQKEAKALLDQQILTAKEYSAVLKEINNVQAGANTSLAKIIASQKNLSKTVKETNKELTKGQKLRESIRSLEYEQIDIASTLQSGLKGNLKEFMGIGKQAQAVADKLKIQYKEQLKSRQITKTMYNELVATASETADIAKNMEVIAKSPVAEGFEELQGYANEAANKIEGVFSSIPGGGMLFNYLGGGALNDQLTAAVTKGAADMAKAMGPARDAMGRFAKKGSADVVQGGKDMIGALSDGMKGFIGQVKGIPNIGMMLGIGAALVAVTALVAVFRSVSQQAHELSEATGVTYTEAKRLNKEARAVQSTFGNQLATMEDITAVQAELVKGMGSAALVSTEVAANVADTAKAFGVSSETAGQVTKELTMMGMSQQEAADLQLETNAAALKAGVNVAAVQEDIAQNAQAAAAYFGGSGKELAKAAVEAAKMGVSIEQMVKTADGLLDIESSLEKQFRAQALTGKNLNFEKARQLALDGKIEEAQKEMLRQAGTIDEFNAMAPHQRKALAEAMGMEVGELQKSLTLQKMRGKLSDDELAAANGLNLSAEELAKMDADQIKAELAKKNAADKTAAAFQKIKNDLIQALAPAAEAFAEIFSALSPVITVLGKIIKVAFLPITLLGKAMQAFMDASIAVKAPIIAIAGAIGLAKLNSSGLLDKMKNLDKTAVKTFLTKKKDQALGFIANSQLGVALGLQKAKEGSVKAENKAKNQGIMSTVKEIGKNALAAAGQLAKGVGAIFSGIMSFLGPFGIPVAIAAVGTMIGLFMKAKAKKAGDVGISPNGGPIVASPQEGAIFQGTKNDGVEMSPTAGNPNSGGGGGSTTAQISSTQMKQIIDTLQQIVQGVQNPPPVQITESQVGQIGNKVSAAKSFIGM